MLHVHVYVMRVHIKRAQCTAGCSEACAQHLVCLQSPALEFCMALHALDIATVQYSLYTTWQRACSANSNCSRWSDDVLASLRYVRSGHS